MNKSAKTTSSLSGIAVGLGFIPVGLIFGYWLDTVYGRGTKYVAATLILVGVLGFFIELQKKLTNKSFRFDNGGVGLVLLIPSIYFAYIVNKNWQGNSRAFVISVLAVLMLVGFMALIDLIVSIFEELVKSNNLKGQVIGLLQFLALVASSAAAIFAALQQLV